MRLFVAQQVPLELRIGQLLLRPPSLEDAQLRALLATGLTASQSLHQISDERVAAWRAGHRGFFRGGWSITGLGAAAIANIAWSRVIVFEHSGEALLKVGNDSLERCRDDLLALLRSGWPQFSPPVGGRDDCGTVAVVRCDGPWLSRAASFLFRRLGSFSMIRKCFLKTFLLALIPSSGSWLLAAPTP